MPWTERGQYVFAGLTDTGIPRTQPLTAEGHAVFDAASPWPQAPKLTLLADLDNDGDFEVDLSPYLLGAEVELGRDRALDSFGPRSAEFILDNEDGQFSPRNVDSPYYPNLKGGRKVRHLASMAMRGMKNLSDNPSAEYDIEGNVAAGGASLARDPAGFIDDFDIDTSALYTSGGDVAATWTWLPEYSALKAVGGTQATLIRDGISLQDVEIEAEIEHSHNLGLILRYQDNDNYYMLAAPDDSGAGNNLNLYSRVAGVFNSLGVSHLNWARGVRHRVQFRIVGSALTVRFDDWLVMDIVDTDIGTAGGVGLRHLSATEESYVHRIEVKERPEVAARARYGRAAVKATTTNADGDGVIHQQRAGTRFPVAPGVDYAAQVSVVATSAKALEFLVHWYNAAAGLISSDSIPFIAGTGDDWAEVSLTATAPDTARTAELSVVTDGAQGVFDFWCDGWALYDSPYVEPYCDGDQGGAEWLTVGAGPSAPHMGSQSYRPLNPTATKFTGAMREFGLSRGDDPKELSLSCSGDVERFVNTSISAGPFMAFDFASSKMRPAWVYNRLLDLLEKGELLSNTALRAVWTAGWVGVNAFSVTHTKAFFDRALEAGAFMWVDLHHPNDAGSGARLDVTSLTEGGKSFRFAAFLGVHDIVFHATPAGYDIKVQLRDTNGVVASAVVTLPDTAFEWVYVEVEGTYTAGAANRYVEILADGAEWSDGDDNVFKIAAFHLVPRKNAVRREMRGIFWEAMNLVYLSGYNRSGQVLVDELLRSSGAWVLENGEGHLVAEDFSTRWPNKRPLVRLSDALDGFGYTTDGYQENVTGLYNMLRIGSYGDLDLLASRPSDMIVWQAEGDITVLPGERRVLRTPFITEGEGTTVAFLLGLAYSIPAGSLVADSTMGNIATPYVLNYGDYAEIVLVGHATNGATVRDLRIGSGSSGAISPGAVRECSETVYFEYDARNSGGWLDEDIRILPLEMAAQGYKTELMSLVGHWAGTKYGSGPVLLDVAFSGSSLAKQLEVLFREPSDTVWLKHKTGQGAFYLDSLFFIEGMKFSFAPGAIPLAVWHLEEA
ncbi:hypothetical protein LCGC14_0830690 [marine sediment metagenome]|uniref:Uncharacterized protein n=1 Tax=marine sediment metagenome TaxID=412755 RepID=A0A0F9PKT1_9ZZZZ